MDTPPYFVRYNHPESHLFIWYTEKVRELLPDFSKYLEILLAVENVRWGGSIFVCLEDDPCPVPPCTAILVLPGWFIDRVVSYKRGCMRNGIRRWAGLHGLWIGWDLAYIFGKSLLNITPRNEGVEQRMKEAIARSSYGLTKRGLDLITLGALPKLLWLTLHPGKAEKRMRLLLWAGYYGLRKNRDGVIRVGEKLTAMGESPGITEAFLKGLPDEDMDEGRECTPPKGQK